jgi:two-component system phosphate regulon response regulator PhoB
MAPPLPVEPRGRTIIALPETAAVAAIAYELARAGYGVSTVHSGPDAIEASWRDPAALVLLGEMLPDVSGRAVLRQLREQASTRGVPIIVLAAAELDEMAAIRAFAAGADDWMSLVPPRPNELVFRVAAVFRRVRARAVPADRVIAIGALRLEYATRRVMLDGRDLNLTPVETTLLFALADGSDRPGSNGALVAMHGNAVAVERRRATKIAISRLRAKLGPASDIIETMRGAGYRLRTRPIPID